MASVLVSTELVASSKMRIFGFTRNALQIVNSDIMVNGDTIQVSRSRRKPFLDALNEYMNEVEK